MAAMMVQAGRRPGDLGGRGLEDPDGEHLHRRYQGRRGACVPDTEVLVGFSQDFVDQAKCKEIALGQIAKGSQVVFQVGGTGLGALDAAKEKGKWGIGVDRDQSDLGAHILTSAVKRVDTSVFETLKAAQEEGTSSRARTLSSTSRTTASQWERRPTR